MGINIDSGQTEIKRRYYALSKKYHPDKLGDHKSMALINNAYDILSDPHKRKLYDIDLKIYQKSLVLKNKTFLAQEKQKFYEEKAQSLTNFKQFKNNKFWKKFAIIAAMLILIFVFISYLPYLSAQKNEPKAIKEPTINKDIVKTSLLQQPEIINYSTITKYNSELENGVSNILQEGEDGERVITFEITYKNGIYKNKRQISDVITKKPIDKIVEIGSKQSENIDRNDTKKSDQLTILCKDGTSMNEKTISVSTCKDHLGIDKILNN